MSTLRMTTKVQECCSGKLPKVRLSCDLVRGLTTKQCYACAQSRSIQQRGNLAIWTKLVPRQARLGLGSTGNPSRSKNTVSNPPISPSSTLPVEVWRRVLSFAVRIPESLTSNYPDPFTNTTSIYSHDEFSREERLAHLLLGAVCMTWRSFVFEFLCEYIIIHGKEDLENLVVKFILSKEDAKETNGLGIGRWTRRIDFRMHRRDTDLACTHTAENVIRLLRLTPNLEIYVNSNGRNTQAPGRTHPRIIETLVQHCGQSLKRVEWNLAECPSWHDLAGLLQNAPNLETLSVITIYGQSIPLPDNTLITLPNLKTLSLGMPTNAPPYLPNSWDPLLSCLSFIPNQLPSIERLDINPFPRDEFFVMHGPKLRILRTNSSDPLPFLPYALDASPNLHTLIIPPNGDIYLADIGSHPSIERIGIFPVCENSIKVPERIYEQHVMQPLEECLLQLEDMELPKLKTIKVRNVGLLADVIDHPLLLQFWWRRWNILGVRFEDKVGKTFEKVISGMFEILHTFCFD